MQATGKSAGYDQLKKLTLIMRDQMNSLEEHLEFIISCLATIDVGLSQGQRTQDKFIRQKKEKVAERLIVEAKNLIEGCNIYLAETDKHRGNSKPIEMDAKKNK